MEVEGTYCDAPYSDSEDFLGVTVLPPFFLRNFQIGVMIPVISQLINKLTSCSFVVASLKFYNLPF